MLSFFFKFGGLCCLLNMCHVLFDSVVVAFFFDILYVVMCYFSFGLFYFCFLIWFISVVIMLLLSSFFIFYRLLWFIVFEFGQFYLCQVETQNLILIWPSNFEICNRFGNLRILDLLQILKILKNLEFLKTWLIQWYINELMN